jgi:segregation and condensation protein B
VRSDELARLEAAMFLAREPLTTRRLAKLARLQDGTRARVLLRELRRLHDAAGTPFRVEQIAGGYQLLTRGAFGPWVRRLLDQPSASRLSPAALETLAIVAYRQPVTRAEIEDIRGVTMSRGTLDILLEIGWIKMRGRKRVPGRPVTYGTTDAFLMHFGLDKVSDLPGLEELRAAGLLEGRIPAAFIVPSPSDSLAMDEDPLEAGDSGETFEPESPEAKDAD